MSTRKVSFAIGEYYHIYNRGTEKRIIFYNKMDYEYFLFLMYVCNTTKSIELRRVGQKFERNETIVDIGAYCLMPNHFHILIREKTEGGISKYMHKLLTAYSMYFNKKYKRSGKLYEGTFKSIHIDNDNYLKYLYSYIHLNPAKLINKNWREDPGDKKDLLNYVLKYPYSSVKEKSYFKDKIINISSFPEYFKNAKNNKDELFEWLNYSNEITL